MFARRELGQCLGVWKLKVVNAWSAMLDWRGRWRGWCAGCHVPVGLGWIQRDSLVRNIPHTGTRRMGGYVLYGFCAVLFLALRSVYGRECTFGDHIHAT